MINFIYVEEFYNIFHSKSLVLVRKGRAFYATLYQEVFFGKTGGGGSLTANWCGTRRNSTRAYVHLLHQLTGFFKSVPPHWKSILILEGIVVAVVDGDEIRDFRFFRDWRNFWSIQADWPLENTRVESRYLFCRTKYPAEWF